MDKITNYQNILTETIKEYHQFLAHSKVGEYDNSIKKIIDLENNHFLLSIIGWQNNRFVYSVLFHFELKNDKVWIQQNNTEFAIADELVEKGVTKKDIVLGFISERKRVDSGFALV